MGCCNKRSCGCFIIAGDNVTITGEGSSTNPFVVSTGGEGSNFSQVASESTNCITLSGVGTALDPLTATLVIDEDSPIPLSCTEDGLRVELPICSEIMCNNSGEPVGTREDDGTGMKYYTLDHTYIDDELPSGWFDCGGCPQ